MITRSQWLTALGVLLLIGLTLPGFINQLNAKQPLPNTEKPAEIKSEKNKAAKVKTIEVKNSSSKLDKSAYMGIQPVSTSAMQQLFPEAKGKPLLVMFHSQYCHDCKRMKPVIEASLPKHPNLVFKSYDVLEDKGRFARIFSAFKPVTVPILVFVQTNGETSQILYNYQKEATVNTNIKAIGG